MLSRLESVLKGIDRMRGWIGGALTIAVAGQAQAQVAAEAPPTVTVTGRGLVGDKADAAYDVTIIGRDRIEQSASGRLEDVLRDVAGLQGFRRADSRSANVTSQSITLRGLGGNASSRALLILDGVPQTDPFGGWVSFPVYATDRLGRIKVTRGGGSGLFGPGALAGTVELDSAAPDQLAPIEAALAYGSRDSLDARGSVAVQRRGAFLTASASFARGDGFIPIVADDRGPIDRPSPYRQASRAARAVIALGASTELQANLSTFDDRRERGLPNTDNRGSGTDGSLRLVGRGATGWSLLVYGQQRRFSSQSASIDDARTTATLVNDQYRVPSYGWGGRAEIVPLSGPLELRLGADLRSVEGETREHSAFVAGSPTRGRIAGGGALTVGGFADATLTRDRLTANVSARLDHWRISDGHQLDSNLVAGPLTDTEFTDRSGWQPTGRAALAYAFGEVTPRIAAYRGWRLATLNELYRPFRVGADATAANASLRPETLKGAEVGLDWRAAPAAKLSATLFTGRLDNAIANVTIAQGPGVFPGVGFVSAAGSYRRRENLDHIRSRGVEFGAETTRGPFDASFSYSLVDAKVRDRALGAALNGLRPAQVPRHQGSATIAYVGPKQLRLSLTARAVSRQYEDDLNQRALAGAVTFDGFAALPVSRRLTLALRGENLFDRRVETAVSGDGIVERALPRTLWLELRLR